MIHTSDAKIHGFFNPGIFNPDYDTIFGPIQKTIIPSMNVCTRAHSC